MEGKRRHIKEIESNIDPTMDFLHESTVVLNQLRKSELFTDIEIECINDSDQKFPAHSVVLASCSGFFRSLFTLRLQDMDNAPSIKKTKSKPGIVGKEIIRRKIQLDIASSALETLLDFMYTGRLNLSLDADKLRSLILASQRLRMPNFASFVVQTLRSLLSVENYSLLWDMAVEFDQRDLRDEVIKFIAQCFSEFSKTEAYLNISSARLKSICQYLQNEATDHDDILCAVLFWVKHDLKTREKELGQILRFISVTRLSSVYIAVLVKGEPLIRKVDRFWRAISGAHVERCNMNKKLRDLSPIRTLFPPCTLTSSSHGPIDELVGRVASAGKRSASSAFRQSLQPWRALDDDALSPRSQLFISKSKQYIHDSLFALDLQTEAMGDACRKLEENHGKLVLSSHHQPRKLQFDSGTLAILGRSRNNNTLMQLFCLKRRTWHIPEDPCEMFTRLNYTLPTGAASAACGSLFLLMGGLLDENCVLDTVMVYDLDSGVFSRRNDMKHARYNAGAAILDGYVYVIGGMGPESMTTHVERNLLCRDTWEEVASLPLPAEQATAAVVDKFVYCLSISEKSSQQTYCFHYDPKTDQWTEINSLPDRCVVNTRLLMTSFDGLLYSMIRRNVSGSNLSTYCYGATTPKWQLIRCTGTAPDGEIIALLSGKRGLWAVDAVGMLHSCNLRKRQWEKDRQVLPVFSTPFCVGILNHS